MRVGFFVSDNIVLGRDTQDLLFETSQQVSERFVLLYTWDTSCIPIKNLL